MKRETSVLALCAAILTATFAAAPEAHARATPPGVPVGLEAGANPMRSGTASLYWRYESGSNGGAPLTSYEVQVGTDASTRVAVAPDLRSHRFEGLTGGRQYLLYVRATNSAGASPWVHAPSVTVPYRVGDNTGEAGGPMDIQWVAIDNGDPLVITTKHRSIPPRPSGSGAYIDVQAGGGPDFLVSGSTYDGDFGIGFASDWHSSVRFFPCRLTLTTNVQLATVTYRIPRPCIGGASFEAQGVRISAIAGTEGVRTDWAPGYRRWSPWVHRTTG